MHAAAGGRGARADENAFVRRRIWIARRKRTREKLLHRVRAAGDVAADDVGVVLLVLRGVPRVPRENAIAEAGSEALDLPLDALGHILGRSIRHVTVTPPRVLARRRARRIEHALLRDENERLLRGASVEHRMLALHDLVERAADVHRRRLCALRGLPRNRTVERPVDFEHARSVAKLAQLADIARGQLIAGNVRELTRSDVEEDGARLREIAHRLHATIRLERAAEGAEITRHRIDD